MTHSVMTLEVRGPHCNLAVHLRGPAEGPPVLMSHAILTSSAMWEAQAERLADEGLRVLCLDTRGHGRSKAASASCTMDDLVADTLAVMDALQLDRAHFVGLSLGGMIGFGLGIAHPGRLLSLLLCDARADTPPDVAAPWDARIALARAQGCAALAEATVERWFGRPFLDARPDLAQRFRDIIGATSTDGFECCARALQGMDYLGRVGSITTPTTLLVGARDGVLPQVMQALRADIAGAELEVVADAGHLPNIDQPARFEAALLRHFARVAGHV